MHANLQGMVRCRLGDSHLFEAANDGTLSYYASCRKKRVKATWLRSAYAFLGLVNHSQIPSEIAMTGKMNDQVFDLQLGQWKERFPENSCIMRSLGNMTSWKFMKDVDQA